MKIIEDRLIDQFDIFIELISVVQLTHEVSGRTSEYVRKKRHGSGDISIPV